MKSKFQPASFIIKEKYPPTKSRLEELLSKEKQLTAIQSKELQQPFVDEFLLNIGTLLALAPKANWEKDAATIIRISFDAARKKFPPSAFEYLNNLPETPV